MIKTNKVFNAEIKDFNDGEMTLVATISTSSKDRMDESVAHDGANLKDFQKNPIVLWAHDYAQPPIGKALWVKKDNENKGLVSKMQFAQTDFAKEIYGLYKGGFMKAFSIGFIPRQIYRNYQQENYDKAKDPFLTIQKWDLLEYSAVPVPANPEALALAMKKGILSEKSFKAFEQTVDTEEVVSEFNNEEKIESPAIKIDVIAEFTAENKLLHEKIEKLNLENAELRLKIFNYLKSQQQKPSEISVEDVLAKTQDIIHREIRRAQGKVD